MSRVSKGKSYEKEVQDILEAQGWTVEKAIPKTVFIAPGRTISIAHDFFNAWDLIAKRQGFKTMWVQVSTWEHVADKRAQVAQFPWTADHDEPVIFARIRRAKGKRPGYRLLYGRNGYEWQGHEETIVRKSPL